MDPINNNGRVIIYFNDALCNNCKGPVETRNQYRTPNIFSMIPIFICSRSEGSGTWSSVIGQIYIGLDHEIWHCTEESIIYRDLLTRPPVFSNSSHTSFW